MAISHVLSSPIADFTGTVTVFNSAGSTITANATEIVRPSDWNSAHNFFQTIGGNTVGFNSFSGTNLIFAGGNNVTLSADTAAGAATIFIHGQGTAGLLSAINVSAGTTSNNLSAFTFSNGSGVQWGLNGSVITASVQTNYLTTARASNDAVGLNTAQTNVTWTVNSAGLSLNAAGYAGTGTSATNASITLNSNGLAISVNPGGGGAAATYSSTVVGMQKAWAQSSSTLGQNSIYFLPEILGAPISAIAMKIPVMITNSSLGSSSGQVGYTVRFGIYTTNATNSTVLTQHYSTSYTLAARNSSNVSRAMSAITAIGNSTSYNTFSSSSAGLNLSSIFHGPREFIMPISSLLTAGSYWFAIHNSSSLAGTSNSVLAVSYIIASSQTGARLGLETSATTAVGIAKNIGYGTYSVTSGALPAAVSLTQINQAATNPIYYIMPVTE